MLREIGGLVAGVSGLIACLLSLLYFFNNFVVLFGSRPFIDHPVLPSVLLGAAAIGYGISIVIIGFILISMKQEEQVKLPPIQ